MIRHSSRHTGNTEKKHREIVEEVVKELKRRSEIRALLLTGSLARGDFTPYSDVEINVIVDKEHEEEFEDEDLWRSRRIRGVFVEISYGSLESWKKRISSQKEDPRCLNQFAEAEILYDSDGVAKSLVNFATKKKDAQFRYPSRFVRLAEYAVKHNKNKILSDLHRGKELAAAMDADFATGWILRGLAYILNIPNTSGRET